MSERPILTYKIMYFVFNWLYRACDYAVAMLFGAAATSLVFDLGVFKYIIYAILVVALLSIYNNQLLYSGTLHIKPMDAHITKEDISSYVLVASDDTDFNCEDIPKEARALIRKYIKRVPGVRLHCVRRLPLVRYVTDEEMEAWTAATRGTKGHYAQLSGVYLRLLDVAIVSRTLGRWETLETTIHELVHHYTSSESECIYITAYIAYLSGSKYLLGRAASRVLHQPGAMELWPKMQLEVEEVENV